MKIFAIVFYVFCMQYAMAQPQRLGTVSFNSGWQFTSIEMLPDTPVDSVRALGTGWNDQFKVVQVDKTDSSILGKVHSLKNVSLFLKNNKWQKVVLPHIAFPEPVPVIKPREGLAFYKKTFKVPRKLKGKKITIEFEGAMQIATIWFNGKFITQHLGGYLPFTIDISHIANYGKENTLFVKLDNRPSPIVPPGKPVQNLDFIYYSGIYRDVWMHVSDPLHITDANVANKKAGGGVFVTYKNVSEKSATVNIQTHIKNENKVGKNFILEQQLIDKSGNIVAQNISNKKQLNAGEDIHIHQSMLVANPALWSPDSPNLYRLKSIVKSDGKITDEIINKVGIRHFYISRKTGLLINGKPVRIVGSNRHMSYPWIGNALSNAANYRDAILIKKSGMNCIRAGHYPMDASFFDACDSLGILLVDCIPGWQFFNKSAIFKQNVYRDIRQTIRRDRNHPSVLLWEVSLNEAYPPATFRCKQNEVAKSEWIGAENFYTSGDSYFTKACWDVPYDDWAKNPYLSRENNTYPNNAYLVREYGDYEFGGSKSTSRRSRSDGEKGMLQQAWNIQWEHNFLKGYYPSCIGDLTWAFYDGLAGLTNEVETWGLADLYRIPKFSYYFFLSQLSKKPMAYIANYWLADSSTQKVIVYSNCDKINLYVNDKLVATKLPDDGPNTHYGKSLVKGGNPFDGGNASRLNAPPFTFTHIHFEPGTLKAVGINNGKEVAVYSVVTPLAPTKIILYADTQGIPLRADGADAVFVRAQIVDEKGSPVPYATNKIHFSISGDAQIRSPKDRNAEAGIASILMQAGEKHGRIKISATADGLEAAVLIIKK